MITVRVQDDGTLMLDGERVIRIEELPEDQRAAFYKLWACDPGASIKRLGFRFSDAVWLYEYDHSPNKEE